MNQLLHLRRRGPLGWALVLLGSLLLGRQPAQAQVDTYTMAPSSGTFTPLTGGTAVAAVQADDALSGALPLGFSFVFDGAPFTTCKVSSNGWLTFNAAATGSSLSNDLSTGVANERPRVAPFWDDLNGSGGTASYLTTGTAPNRVFTFEWLNWIRFGNTGGPSFSMQVQLVEGTNVVRFVYRQETAATSNVDVSIGLSGVGTGSGSFLSLSDASAAPSISSTVEASSIATRPATGQVYAFAPPVASACPTPRGLTTTATTATTASVRYTVTNASPGPFTLLYGPVGFNPALPSSPTNSYVTTTAAGTTATFNGLTASTAYQFYVTQNCGANGNSGQAGPATFATACVTPLYATLPVLESFENTWINRCDTRDVPTNSWRNTPLTGNNSWRREDDGTSGAWAIPTSYAYTPAGSQGAHSARFHSGQASSGQIGTFDLFVDLSAAGAKRLSFDYINTSGSDSLVVQLSTDGGLTFGRLAGYNQSGTAAAFVTQVLPLTTTSATAVLRFRGRADFGITDIGLDNIVLELATGCLTPANLTATTTTTGASLSWLTGGTGTYTLVYGPSGFNPATAGTTVPGLTAPPYVVAGGLTPGTTYQFYVTLNCAAGANSATAGPQSFTTQILNDEPCGATVLTVANACIPLATTTFGATPTTGVPAGSCNSFPTTTPADVWFKFVTAATGPTSTQVRISVTGAGGNTLRGYSAATCSGPLTFLACSSATNGTSPAPNLDLTGLSPSTTYYVRVGAFSSFQPVLGTFTICATPVPNCPTPSGLSVGTLTGTTAVVSWAAPAAPGSTFTVVYGPAGFTPNGTGSTALTGITAQTTTLTGLTPNTGYEVYVQQVCSGFNGSSTLSSSLPFSTPLTVPGNNEPCGAITLGATAVSGSNVGATTSSQTGINTPACSPAQLPKDVWFAFAATTTARPLTITGTAAGMVRVFTSPDCTLGPFNQVFCQSGGANNTNVGPINLTGLTVGTRYYVAVSGYGSGDTTGPFVIAGPLATRAQADTNALLVYPNPSNTGQLTLRLSTLAAGQATLLNALGQRVLSKALIGTAEQTVSTQGLAAGVYTLRVAVAGQVLTRKVVLE